MRIVQITDFFHPNAGYQINILSKYMIKQGHELTIVAGELDKIPKSLTDFFGRDNINDYDRAYTEKTGVEIIRLPLLSYISGRAIFDSRLETTVDELNPDALFIHDIDTLVGIKYIINIHKLKYPIVYNSSMLEMASVNPFSKQYRWFYRMFITPKIIKYKLKVIRIQDDNYVEKCLGIPLSQSPFISVGSDTMLFYPNSSVKQKVREEYNISKDDFVVIYTGKLIESKGAKLLAKTFQKKLQNKKSKNIVLLVVGSTSGEYGQKVEDIFNISENRVIRLATQKYFDLAQFYQAADLSVFPKECSLSFYDAQACGLPVVSEDNNVNVDRLKYNNGSTFKAGDIEDFRDKLIKYIEMDQSDFNQIGENAYRFVKNNYDYEDIAKQYTEILVQEYNKFKNR